METFLLPVLAAALIKQAVDLFAFISAKDWKAVAKIVLSYVVAIGVVFLVKGSGMSPDYVLPGTDSTLGDLNAYGSVVVGLMLAGAAAFGANVIASRDDKSSAYVPPLGGPPAGDA